MPPTCERPTPVAGGAAVVVLLLLCVCSLRVVYVWWYYEAAVAAVHGFVRVPRVVVCVCAVGGGMRESNSTTSVVFVFELGCS